MEKQLNISPVKPATPPQKAVAESDADGLVEESAGAYATPPPAPSRTKTFRVGGSQAVRLPKAFRLPDGEVTIEKRGDEIVLKATPKSGKSDEEILEYLRYLKKNYTRLAGDWPAVERPGPETHRPIPRMNG